ncbi:uncharacterized protein [Watersipora subatra]|uniref:uncharacterized protein n=1 Tax=Watersipora subatra TaxID=2589382 RepID=UPI00355B3CD8
MRASIILVVIVGLFAAGQADLIDNLKETAGALANNLLDQVKEAAKGILGNLIGTLGKRDVLPLVAQGKALFGKLNDLLHKGKDLATSALANALHKLKAISDKFHDKLASLTDAQDAKDAVDDVVAEHHVRQKRILEGLLQKGKDLLNSAVESIKGALSNLKGKASDLVSTLLQKGANVLVGKRTTLSEHLQNIGTAISSAVSPFKDIVAGLGNTLKGHFSNLVDTVKGHVNALKGKLSGHVDDLKAHGNTLLEHGKNALGALSEAVSDILKQTLSNAQPAIDGIGNTINSAVDTIGKHFTGADQTN